MDRSLPRRPRIAFSIGDVNGIGLEVLAGALAHASVLQRIEPVVVGDGRLVRAYADAVPAARALTDVPIDQIDAEATLRLGKVDAAAGRLAHDAIVRATRMVVAGEADALVTLPISKEAMIAGGSAFAGHTELIASITGGEPMMILMTRGMLVALATIHVPLARVPSLITPETITTRARQLDATLRGDFACERPRIAVLALNPHAGENGVIGSEEIETIAPALEALRPEGLALEGPFPADGFFARFTPGAYDGILAMYHDQGLVPLKLYARGGGVNFTASLPIVRTSPDHGTAFAIAGQGIADARSTVEAIGVACEVVRNRRNANGTTGANR